MYTSCFLLRKLNYTAENVSYMEATISKNVKKGKLLIENERAKSNVLYGVKFTADSIILGLGKNCEHFTNFVHFCLNDKLWNLP